MPRNSNGNQPLPQGLGGADDPSMAVLEPGSPSWPTQLDDLTDPPAKLWQQGPANVRVLASRSVAIVGSRDASDYGLALARDWAAELAARGYCIVSGGALGIDAAAHRGALHVDGSTIVVLAGGVNVDYPAANATLLGHIRQCGAVLSEAPVSSRPMRHWFLLRNRIIAALTRGTIVVEAGYRSGALSTAVQAVGLNRIVMAVPGRADSPRSAGPHRLIRDSQAVLVSDPAHVDDLLSPLGSRPGPSESSSATLALPTPDREQAASDRDPVLDRLPPSGRWCSAQMIATDAGVAVPEVLTRLGRLELAGLVESGASGWRRRRGEQ